LNPKFATGLAAIVVRTSGSRHWRPARASESPPAARRGALQCSKRGEALVNINENTSAVGNGDAVPRGLKKAEPLEIFAKKRARAEPMQCSTNNRSQGDNKGGNKQQQVGTRPLGTFRAKGRVPGSPPRRRALWCAGTAFTIG
jgi:hypothetical protein